LYKEYVGNVVSVAGDNSLGLAGYNDGVGSNALFNNPTSFSVLPDGSILTADTISSVIRKISFSGTTNTVTTFAGHNTSDTNPLVDATGTNARFNIPVSLTTDASGNIYVADLGNNAIRKMTTGGVVNC
jgi:hypothetical protein